jgi:hypothetical protein
MRLGTKTYWLTDWLTDWLTHRQSQCDFDFDQDSFLGFEFSVDDSHGKFIKVLKGD